MSEQKTTEGFDDYLPLSAVRIAPGEYVIETKSGVKLWYMEGRSLAEWVCSSLNAKGELERRAQEAADEIVNDHLRPCQECFGNAMADVRQGIIAAIVRHVGGYERVNVGSEVPESEPCVCATWASFEGQVDGISLHHSLCEK